jgi:hypothetical protein
VDEEQTRAKQKVKCGLHGEWALAIEHYSPRMRAAAVAPARVAAVAAVTVAADVVQCLRC